MKKLAASIVALMFLGTATIIISCNNGKEKSARAVVTNISKDSMIKRDAYLVTIMGCNDCHSPKKLGPNGPEPDKDRLLSGHPADMPLGKINPSELKSWVLFNQNLTAFVGPWGVSYAANLT